MDKTASQGSDIVLRGLMLLALLIIVVLGGFAMFFRRSNQPPPTAVVEPAPLIAMFVQPSAGFPASVAWAPMLAVADEMPSGPGWHVRYQAARNLAYRGSDKIPWDVYRELLDEHRQFCNFRVRLDDGRLVTEEGSARQIILGALKDLAVWHTKQDRSQTASPPMLEVYAAVDKLADSPILELRTQAEKTRATFLAAAK